MDTSIHRFVLTGGPCAGKTTALAYLRQKLEELGYYVITVPEAATILINAGVSPKAINVSLFQKLVIEEIIALERAAAETARYLRRNAVILCDRGIPDAGGYIDNEEFEAVLASLNTSLVLERDARYDAVFHLRTAALGAEAFYTLENNSARMETPEEARRVDERTLSAWVGHPHLRVVPNDGASFSDKLKRLYQEVCAALGVPVPLEIERKFLIEPFSARDHLEAFQTIDIEQRYLASDDPAAEVRVRKRGRDGSFVFYRTTKKKVAHGVRMEIERIIGEEEYLENLVFADPERIPIRKERTCFVHRNQYFEYDRFLSPPGLHLLEIELTEQNRKVDLPAFIRVIKEVTDDPTYSNAELARA